MKRKSTSKCPTCSKQKKSARKRPYGTTGTNIYCNSCDRDWVYNISKSGERKKVKRFIKKEIDAN